MLICFSLGSCFNVWALPDRSTRSIVRTRQTWRHLIRRNYKTDLSPTKWKLNIIRGEIKHFLLLWSVKVLPQQNLPIGCPGLAKLPNSISLRCESDGLANWYSEQREEKSREGGRHSDKQHKPGLVFVFSSEPDRCSILGADADMGKLKISDINTLANITRFLQWSLKMCLSKHISMLWRQDVDCLMCSHSWKHNASFYSSHQHRGIKPKVWLWLNRRPVRLDPSELKWADDM